MEEKELIELYIQRNNLAKSSNMEEANKITEDINNKLPTKLSKRGFKDGDGNVVEFEILGIANNVRWIGDFPCLTKINGNKIYNRILIKRRA